MRYEGSSAVAMTFGEVAAVDDVSFAARLLKGKVLDLLMSFCL